MNLAVHDGMESQNFYQNAGKNSDIQSHHAIGRKLKLVRSRRFYRRIINMHDILIIRSYLLQRVCEARNSG